MSRQTSSMLVRVLAQLWCLLALAAIANATPVASSVSKIAIADASAATIAVTRSLRDVSRAARAAPIATERRGETESDGIQKVDISMCKFYGDTFECALQDNSDDCRARSDCVWSYNFDSDSFKCRASSNSFDETALEYQIASYVDPQKSRCDDFSGDASACAIASNCETTVGCTPTKTFVESVVTDPVTAEMVYLLYLCGPIESVEACNSREECTYDNDDGECSFSDEGLRRVLHAFVHECDFDEEIAEARRVLARSRPLPVPQAQIVCAQITTEAECNTTAHCEWVDPGDSAIDSFAWWDSSRLHTRNIPAW